MVYHINMKNRILVIVITLIVGMGLWKTTPVKAASLSDSQISSIILLLQAFRVDHATLINVYNALRGPLSSIQPLSNQTTQTQSTGSSSAPQTTFYATSTAVNAPTIPSTSTQTSTIPSVIATSSPSPLVDVDIHQVLGVLSWNAQPTNAHIDNLSPNKQYVPFRVDVSVNGITLTDPAFPDGQFWGIGFTGWKNLTPDTSYPFTIHLQGSNWQSDYSGTFKTAAIGKDNLQTMIIKN